MPRNRDRYLRWSCGVLLSFSALAQTPAALYSGMRWRLIGPFRGGRVEAVAGAPSQPETYYFGGVVGGIWKTTDNGLRWKPIFNHAPVASIGAIAVAPSNPGIIYAGTGESAPRGDMSFGDGMYKSTDGGRSWRHIGLSQSRQIGSIVINPHNPREVLAAALGDIFGPSPRRGIYRTTDGGRTWKRVLYVNDRTGGIALAMDPANARIIFAGMWQVTRTPWNLASGGPGSGLYESRDGGRSWKQLRGHGLPAGVWGRIGVAVAGGDQGRRIYALIEAHQGGLFRSDDGGKSWTRVSADQRLRTRAWYFTNVFAAPHDPNTVFVANNSFLVSHDGGRHFKPLPIPGGDNHAFWQNPLHPRRMIEGNDQGVVLSVDGGRSWSRRNNQPIGQFYHVSASRGFPVMLYGAQQDEGAIAIASYAPGGITSADYYNVGGDDGECGYVFVDPANPRYVIAGGYGGALTRYDTRTHQLFDIAPWHNNYGGHAARHLKYRFTWTSPLAFDPRNPHILYMGSQYLLETSDLGAHWRRISPDLTRNDKSKQGQSGGPITHDDSSIEYYDVIYSIAPSHLREGLIWVGTDDGLVQLTRDGGRHWQNVTPAGLPAWSRVTYISASRFAPGTAYLAADNHRNNDDAPYLFRTTDYGKSWTRITAGLPAGVYMHVVRQDHRDPDLLFAGSETGAYVSFDQGNHWQALQMNLPTASIRDFAERDNTLYAATHGRSLWALDDITPLRHLAAAQRQAAYLFPPARVIRLHAAGNYNMTASGVGQNPPAGAVIDYYLAHAAHAVTLSIRDGNHQLGMRFSSPACAAGGTGNRRKASPACAPPSAGEHRLVWNLRYPLPPPIPGAAYDERAPRGVLAIPGTYTATLRVDGQALTRRLRVSNDPRENVPQAVLAAQFKLASRVMAMMGEDHKAVNQILALRARIHGLLRQLQGAGRKPERKVLRSLDARAAGIENQLYQSHAKTDEELLNFPTELNSKLQYLEDEIDFGDGAPTQPFEEMTAHFSRQLDRLLGQWRQVKRKMIPAADRGLEAQGIGPLS